MTIGLLSDTHGHLDEAYLRFLGACDEIWHAGDIGSMELMDTLEEGRTVRAVYGNIDDHLMRRRYPEHQRFTLEGVDVWMTHIGGRPGRYSAGITPVLKQGAPRLFICGHSHLCLVQRDPVFNGMLYMNPGAAGVHGFHKVRTMLRFALNEGQIQNLEVIELGPRVQRFTDQKA